MLGILIRKELTATLLSPKFGATFAVCAALILLSVLIGIQEYRAAVRQYDEAIQLAAQNLRTESSWMGLSTHAYRRPDPMQLLITGVNNDVGRASGINQVEDVKLTNSLYSEDTIFALFRSVDLTFIVSVVLSLFAILFTYDAVNGEREGGTLQLTFANPVPRATFILAKLLGSWLSLVIPLLVPLALGGLVLLLSGIPFSVDQLERLALFLVVSLLYFTLFIALGVLFSTLMRKSSMSFLVSLSAWVVLVLIVPRLGVMAAGAARPIPSVAETEAQVDAFAKDRWEAQMQAMQSRWQQRQEAMRSLTPQEREAYQRDHEHAWTEDDAAGRRDVERDIDAFSLRVSEDFRNRKSAQERIALSLARISPASSYQLAAMSVAGTDISLKSRYEDAMRAYRSAFTAFVDKKQQETGHQGGFRITVDSQTGFHFSAPRERGTLDVSNVPVFSPPQSTFGEMAASVAIDAGLLSIVTLLSYAGAFLTFLRYDIR
ncbi:MAG TPA: ABC transporter permease subunit [Bacteroidota bacterium]|nr:ABC transporter permease subunit [Bacteroidota bacterium]